MVDIKRREYAVAISKRGGNILSSYNQMMVVPRDRKYWAADPFPIEVDGVLYIFAELYVYKESKGSIGYTKYRNGKFSPWKIIISEKYHLSFPNIFKFKNKYYICPESNESGEIYFYKCIDFPDKWVKLDAIVSGGRYCDTIFYCTCEGNYGLTYQIKQNESQDNFRLFRIENNVGVFSDNSIMEIMPKAYQRPGGRILYSSETGLNYDIGVFQIGEPSYGTGLILKKICVNWPNYKEKEIRKLYVKDFSFDKKYGRYISVHTLNYTENYQVIDVGWWRINLLELYYRMKIKIRKILKKISLC